MTSPKMVFVTFSFVGVTIDDQIFVKSLSSTMPKASTSSTAASKASQQLANTLAQLVHAQPGLPPQPPRFPYPYYPPYMYPPPHHYNPLQYPYFPSRPTCVPFEPQYPQYPYMPD
ncbi:hypothetical protein DFH28DRAFT_939475 [Melampsora americana]|nr:hypothetical protein DFH28DRAFT_939475 [Melampsora americana]